MSDDIKKDLLKPESKDAYEADTANYFKNIGTTKQPGISADDLSAAKPHLPSARQETAYAERLEKGFSKVSRSGAATNAATGLPAIRPNGLKFASDFVDEFTSGKYVPQKEMKPPTEQKAPTGYFPKPAVILDRCLDCMEPVSQQQYVLGMTIVSEDDSQKLLAMKVKFGDLIVYNVCVPCFEAAKTIARDTTPLALVFGGQLTDFKDIALAQKYGFPVQMHDGTEKTFGQWRMIERAERVMNQLWEYLAKEPADSPIFRANKVKDDKGN